MGKDLLAPKLVYFFLFAARGSFLPYLNIFLVSTGLTITQAGFISGFRMIISCFSSPCWSFIGEITKFSKFILWFLISLSTTLIFPMPWLSKNVHSWYELNKNNCTTMTTILYHDQKLCSKQSKDEVLFLALLTVNLGNALFHLPIPLYIDQMVNKLMQGRHSGCFENQRIFAALGFAMSALLTGILCDKIYVEGFSRYLALFYVYITMIVCLILSTYPFFRVIERSACDESDCETDDTNTSIPHRKTHAFQLLIATFCNFNVIIFLITVVLMGTANQLTYGYLFFFIEELKGSKTIMGIAIFSSSFSEFLFQKLIDRVVHRVRRPLICMNIAVFTQFIRFLLISVVKNAWYIIPIQTLHCVSYALFWSAAKKQTRMISPLQIAPSVYAFVHVLHFDFSGIIAFIGGGFVYEHFKGHLLFRWTSFIYIFWTLVIALQFTVLRREEVKRESVVEMEHLDTITEI